MATRQQRYERIKKVAFDESTGLFECAAYLYYWIKYERGLDRIERIQKRGKKYQKKLNDFNAVYNLRKEMTHI